MWLSSVRVHCWTFRQNRQLTIEALWCAADTMISGHVVALGDSELHTWASSVLKKHFIASFVLAFKACGLFVKM